jgi:pimeloyl-ACP methyl ester carboxylesterase
MTTFHPRSLFTAGVLLLLTACTAHGDPTRPVPTAFIPAPRPATRLFVVLPGRADDLGRLRRSGAAQAIQSAWPDADVVLAELTIDYYLQRDAASRLHDVIAPLRARGYREVWLGGASLGGMGSLVYDMAYPQDIDGLVLLAPYLGEPPVIAEITAQGGVDAWQPIPASQPTPQAWQRDLWRKLQAWSHDTRRTRNVWLAYGDDDRLRIAEPLLAPMLPPGHVRMRRGGHSWRVWTPALREILEAQSAIAAADASTAPPPPASHTH